jgi:uncharacterized protein (TIGR02145 family)
MKHIFLFNKLILGKLIIVISILLIFFNCLSSCLSEEEQTEIKFKPVTVETTIPSSISHNTIICGGTISAPQERNVKRGVCWSTAQNPVIPSSLSTSDGKGLGKFTSTISGLSANTTYYIRAYASSSLSNVYGNQITVKTSNITIATISTSSISSVSTSSAICGGNIVSDGGSSITVRGVCWSTSSNPTTNNNKTSDGTGSGLFTSTLTGLSSNSTYYVRAFAVNSSGTAYGSQVSFKTLTITLPTIATTTFTSITRTAAICGGNITSDGGGSIISRGVCWSTTTNPTIANSTSSDGIGAGSFSCSLTGLTPGVTYYARAYATNSAGTSYGSQLSFTTIPIYIPTVTTTNFTSLTTTTAIFGGNVTDDGGGTVTARGVCWSTAINPTITSSKTSDGIGTGLFSSSLSGLTPGTTYYIRAYATNSAGTSYGSQLNFNTIPIYLPTISTVSVSSITPTTATCGGNVSNDGGATVTARGVCWGTAINPTVSSSKTSDGTGIGSFTSTLTGLTPGITYYVRSYATNSTGTSYGSQLTFSTVQINLPTVTTTNYTSLTTTTAIFGGNVTNEGGGAVTARGVCWSTTLYPTITNSKTSDGTGTGSFSSSLSGLTPGATYYIRAYATNIAGTSYGSQLTFKTIPIYIPTITTALVSSITTTTAICGGNVSNDGGATVSARGVCWATTANPTITGNKSSNGTGTGSFTSTLTGLSPGVTYYVRAYATNSSGTAYGSQLSFTSASNTVTDIDGNIYNIITIGTQTWMVQNLKVTHYRNGDVITNITSSSTWASSTTGAWCDYSNTATNGTKYGHLYNWYAVADPRNIAPVGWHVATDVEWTTLQNYLTANGFNYDGSTTGNFYAKSLAAKTDWTTSTVTGAVGNNLTLNNSSGFTALPGGYFSSSAFTGLLTYARWWTSTQATTGSYSRRLYYTGSGMNSYDYAKNYGLSVRCVKD